MEKYKDPLNLNATAIKEFSDMCRVCAMNKPKKEIQNLFKTQLQTSLAEQLHTCLKKPVRENDGLPQNICNRCVSLLLVAYRFHLNCAASERRFTEILSKHFPDEKSNDTPSKSNDAENKAFPPKAGEDKTAPIESIVVSSDDEVKSTSKVETVQPTTLISPNVTFECFQCKRQFENMPRLRNHLIFCTSKMHQCQICKKLFAFLVQLKRHKSELKHYTEKELFQCEYCSMKYRLFKDLLPHVRTHEQLKTYKCIRCSNKYPLKLELERHMLHCKGAKKNVCNVCNQAFREPSTLRSHMQTHDTAPSALCSECGKAFKSNGHLKVHLKTHLEKGHACTECPARFAQLGGLKRHRLIHSGARNLCCDKCPSRFITQYDLKKHEKSYHGEKLLTCTMCPKRFSMNKNLVVHMRTHTGEKPYQCEFCDRAYAQSNDLNKHRRTHVGDNTYQCIFCPNAFRLKIDLRNHLSDHYKEQKEKINDHSDDAESEKLKEIEQEFQRQRR